MNGEQTVNLNSAQCIRTSIQLGQDVVYNICSGAQAVVPWGLGGWALFCIAVGLGLSIIAVFVGVAVMMVRGH